MASWEHRSDGGPIIERERITTGYCGDTSDYFPRMWFAQYEVEGALRTNCHSVGLTPLIAAMRAYVASRFGEEVGL
jgi:hypothetical protein